MNKELKKFAYYHGIDPENNFGEALLSAVETFELSPGNVTPFELEAMGILDDDNFEGVINKIRGEIKRINKDFTSEEDSIVSESAFLRDRLDALLERIS